jgi:glycine reductase
MDKKLRIAHYINQFFAQLGGEDMASIGIVVREGPIGPGLMISKLFPEEAEVVVTVICGDNHIAENLKTATQEIVDIFRKYKVDMVLAGPAYAAGRYGVGCGSVCLEAERQLGIPAVTAMNEDNPGVTLYKKALYIMKAGKNARTMTKDLPAMYHLAKRLAEGEKIGLAEEEGYFERGLVRNVRSDRRSTARAVDMLLDKFYGREFKTEVPLPEREEVPPAPPLSDLSTATLVMITDGGLYPAGNPDHMPPANPDVFHYYPLGGGESLKAGNYEVSHNGYDPAFIHDNPNRLVPLDGMRELEKQHFIGKLHDCFMSTTGLTTTIANSKKIAASMAEYIRSHDIDAAILTST